MLAASGAACQDPPTVAAKREGAPRPQSAVSPDTKAKVAPADRKDSVVVDPGQPPVDPEQARFMPIPGDPPYVDGYNPEEETCPSGNWCGTIATATPLTPHPEMPTTFDCPDRIIGAHNPSPIEGPAYEGLSSQGTMQGSLNKDKTGKERANGNDDICCYHWFEYCSGRPLRDEGEHRVAQARPGRSWSADLQPHDDGGIDRVTRQALAKAWLEDALAEHASIAAFGRVTLELMAHGAPPELLAATQAAALDEIEHARCCFALAGRYGGSPVAPGGLVTPPPRTGDLARLAVDTFIEGCVGETIAALVAERALTRATDPDVRATLAQIAEDESRHAALAWRTLAWALEQGGEPVRAMLRRAGRDVGAAPASVPALPDRIDTLAWSAHGRLDAISMAEASRDATRDIIVPMLDRLLATDDRRVTLASSV